MRSMTCRALLAFLLMCGLALPVYADHGRTQGSFGVSMGGTANYTIPIWTPPGPNGLTPPISLNYSSGRGNDLGGVGWALAVSSIERCALTKHQDGISAAPSFAPQSRYCLDGNRLRLFSGTYGTAGSVYFTELADYSRITAYGSSSGGPQYFIVEGKDGLIYEYGNTTDSRVVFGINAVLKWMLNKVSDRNGNSYVISYHSITGYAIPNTISWTPTTQGGSSYRYQAKFNYITNRTDADSKFAQVAGFQSTNRYRLENIQIKSAGVVKRKYVFSYGTSSVTSRSLLTSAKECADDAESNCLLPLTFTYQTGVAGVTAGASSAPSGSSNSLVKGRYDFNGDGLQDVAYWGGSNWQVALSTGSGFSTPYNTGISSGSVLVDDFLPNGRAALLASVSGTLWTYRWDDATSSFVGATTGVTSALPTTSLDYNGDKKADLVYFVSGANYLHVRANTSPVSGNPTFSASAAQAGVLTSPRIYANIYPYSGNGLPRADVNGDGRQDLNAHIVYTGMGGGSTAAMILLGSSSGTGFDLSTEMPGAAPNWPAVDFNGDNCTDRHVNMTIQVAACSGVAATSVSIPAFPSALYDWNGDGKTDIIVSGGVYLSTGNGFSSFISTSAPTGGFAIDLDGDNIDDYITPQAAASPFNWWTHTSSGQVPPSYATNIPDLLASVTDGFGISHSPHYVSTSWSNYDKGATTNFPLQESGPRIVVAAATSSDGNGGTFDKTYFYVGARDHAERASSVGFQRVDETDGRTGLITRTYFEQTFPVAGMVSQREVMQPNGTTNISRVVYTNSFVTLDATTNNQRYFTYPSASTATEREVGGSFNDALLRTITTANTFDSATGTLYDQTVTTTEATTGNGVHSGGVWTARTHSPFANLFTDSTNWCLGRPGKTEQTNSHNLSYGGTAITRTTEVTWNGPACRPTKVVEEPSSTSIKVSTDLGYDAYGNVSSTTVTGVGMTARTTSVAYSDAGHLTGQFPLSVTNALGEISSIDWDYDLGVPLSTEDANDLITAWQYDAFGRRIQEDRLDGTATTWTVSNCTTAPGGCLGSNNKTYVVETSLDSAGATVADAASYLDAFDRPITTKSKLLGGDYSRVNIEYDDLGRVSRQSVPCFWSSCTNYWIENDYDLVSRVIKVTRPVSDSNATPQYTEFHYEGLRTTVEDAQGKNSIKVLSGAGLLARSIDHDGYYQQFDYDAFGNPVRVQDSLTNTLQSSVFNIRGMLTSRTDMDMGTWTFTPNALGEVVSQTDAKSQTTTFQFDLLGRLTSRTEAEGTSTSTSTWTWGASAHNTFNNKYIGSLKSVSSPSYTETYTNDSLGRLSKTEISADTSYQIDYAYNSLGALDTLTYPTSTSSYRLKLQYEYQNGQLHRIKDFNAPTTIFWTANATNPRNLVTQETLGNGLVTNRAFDAVTGWLKSIQTGASGGSGVQNLAYTWDLVGNLKTRKDANQSNLTEEFFYDNLYRLDYSTLTGVGTNLDLAYDAMGNITSKSDVGNYSYHASKKHQVTGVDRPPTGAGGGDWTFAYDNNGNMTSGRGSTITWTSFNYPASIANGSDTAAFSYTPDRRYWKQVSNYTSGGAATTIYVGDLLEKVTTGAGTDFRHMIRAGGSTIIVSRQTSSTNSTHYVTRDHLGGSAAITNDSGGIVVNSSFDAFGKRRGPNWTGSPTSGDWAAFASTTRRGYTDHTMLDNLSLIHMNGRVQDPVLGRFSSADPFITEPLQTQNYNRYSYVYNRPLSYADPSGFGIVCTLQVLMNRTTTDSSVETEDGTTFQNGPMTALTFAGYLVQCEWQFEGTGGNGGGTQPDPNPCAGEWTTELTQAEVDTLDKALRQAVDNADPSKVTPDQLRDQLNLIANRIVGAHRYLVPEAPPNASYTSNILLADAHRVSAASDNLVPNIWFKDMVRNGGPWDYKNNAGPQYEAAGNFNFGATGYAVYRESRYPLVGAGWAQNRAGTAYSQWGSPGRFPLSTANATGFFGDDPKDQFWATQGIQFAQLQLGECERKK